MQDHIADKVDHITDIVARVAAGVAVAPGAASVLSMQWWNENSAGVVAMCAMVGAVVSVASFSFGLWHSGKIGRIMRRMRGK